MDFSGNAFKNPGVRYKLGDVIFPSYRDMKKRQDFSTNEILSIKKACQENLTGSEVESGFEPLYKLLQSSA